MTWHCPAETAGVVGPFPPPHATNATVRHPATSPSGIARGPPSLADIVLSAMDLSSSTRATRTVCAPPRAASIQARGWSTDAALLEVLLRPTGRHAISAPGWTAAFAGRGVRFAGWTAA